ncbi:hypothetical protein BDK51DRAFT_31874 [Blyttiomyces helicus]|uniref:GATA-type domain-containing protein n=1 Tax=Blyttiomyces helicus TaxID=388810 RepID=A0A4P9WF55_9FUNG|nr:hypothetical protein BDK51DRAFT_31874 [Blyttiomyces helicus]|eukprot:RKO91369.1 hypothetical protein BDK51DRAFT_31874 [Blyttiomyces helicus]
MSAADAAADSCSLGAHSLKAPSQASPTLTPLDSNLPLLPPPLILEKAAEPALPDEGSHLSLLSFSGVSKQTGRTSSASQLQLNTNFVGLTPATDANPKLDAGPSSPGPLDDEPEAISSFPEFCSYTPSKTKGPADAAASSTPADASPFASTPESPERDPQVVLAAHTPSPVHSRPQPGSEVRRVGLSSDVEVNRAWAQLAASLVSGSGEGGGEVEAEAAIQSGKEVFDSGGDVGSGLVADSLPLPRSSSKLPKHPPELALPLRVSEEPSLSDATNDTRIQNVPKSTPDLPLFEENDEPPHLVATGEETAGLCLSLHYSQSQGYHGLSDTDDEDESDHHVEDTEEDRNQTTLPAPPLRNPTPVKLVTAPKRSLAAQANTSSPALAPRGAAFTSDPPSMLKRPTPTRSSPIVSPALSVKGKRPASATSDQRGTSSPRTRRITLTDGKESCEARFALTRQIKGLGPLRLVAVPSPPKPFANPIAPPPPKPRRLSSTPDIPDTQPLSSTNSHLPFLGEDDEDVRKLRSHVQECLRQTRSRPASPAPVPVATHPPSPSPRSSSSHRSRQASAFTASALAQPAPTDGGGEQPHELRAEIDGQPRELREESPDPLGSSFLASESLSEGGSNDRPYSPSPSLSPSRPPIRAASRSPSLTRVMSDASLRPAVHDGGDSDSRRDDDIEMEEAVDADPIKEKNVGGEVQSTAMPIFDESAQKSPGCSDPAIGAEAQDCAAPLSSSSKFAGASISSTPSQRLRFTFPRPSGEPRASANNPGPDAPFSAVPKSRGPEGIPAPGAVPPKSADPGRLRYIPLKKAISPSTRSSNAPETARAPVGRPQSVGRLASRRSSDYPQTVTSSPAAWKAAEIVDDSMDEEEEDEEDVEVVEVTEEDGKIDEAARGGDEKAIGLEEGLHDVASQEVLPPRRKTKRPIVESSDEEALDEPQAAVATRSEVAGQPKRRRLTNHPPESRKRARTNSVPIATSSGQPPSISSGQPPPANPNGRSSPPADPDPSRPSSFTTTNPGETTTPRKRKRPPPKCKEHRLDPAPPPAPSPAPPASPTMTQLEPRISSQACTHCGTRTTTAWRRGPEGPDSLCFFCGKHFLLRGTMKGFRARGTEAEKRAEKDSPPPPSRTRRTASRRTPKEEAPRRGRSPLSQSSSDEPDDDRDEDYVVAGTRRGRSSTRRSEPPAPVGANDAAARQPRPRSAAAATRDGATPPVGSQDAWPAGLKSGDKVWAVWKDKLYYPATINARMGKKFTVSYDDGGDQLLEPSEMRPLNLAVGDRCIANVGPRSALPARIVQILSPSSYKVALDPPTRKDGKTKPDPDTLLREVRLARLVVNEKMLREKEEGGKGKAKAGPKGKAAVNVKGRGKGVAVVEPEEVDEEEDLAVCREGQRRPPWAQCRRTPGYSGVLDSSSLSPPPKAPVIGLKMIKDGGGQVLKDYKDV